MSNKIKLNSDDKFLVNFEKMISSMDSDDAIKTESGSKYLMNFLFSYLDSLYKEEKHKLANNTNYLSYMMKTLFKNSRFCTNIRYGLGFAGINKAEPYRKYILNIIENDKYLMDAIRDSVEKAIENSHLKSIKRMIKKSRYNYTETSPLGKSEEIFNNPYKPMNTREEMVNSTWNDNYLGEVYDCEAYDIFGILETFKTSKKDRVGGVYKRKLMEEKLKN